MQIGGNCVRRTAYYLDVSLAVGWVRNVLNEGIYTFYNLHHLNVYKILAATETMAVSLCDRNVCRGDRQRYSSAATLSLYRETWGTGGLLRGISATLVIRLSNLMSASFHLFNSSGRPPHSISRAASCG